MLEISEMIMKKCTWIKSIQYKDEADKKRKKIIILCFALIILLLCCRVVSIFVFQENDDYFFTRLISGKETGICENKFYFIKVILGTVLAGLYRVNSTIPWFPILLEICLFCYYAVLLFNALKQNNSLMGDGLTVILFGIFFSMMFLPQIINIQFTVAASALCSTVVVLIAVVDEMKRVYLISFIMAMLAFSIRYECFLMAIPFVGMGMFIKLLRCRDKKKVIKNSIFFACACVAGVFIGTIINNAAYGSAEWKEYVEYTKARSQLFDYPGVPSYEENVSLFDELNISEAEWRVTKINNHLSFNRDIGTSQLKSIAQGKKVIDKKSVIEIFIEVVIKNLIKIPALSAIICLGYIFSIVLGIYEKENRKKIFLLLSIIKFVTLLVWFYVVYKGRYPERIVISLYYLEFACLYSVCLTYFTCEKASVSLRKISAKFCTVGMIVIFLVFGIIYMYEIRRNVIEKMEYSTSYRELQSYFNVNGQNFYYCDVAVISGGITNNIFVDDIVCVNQASMGGWLPRSPLYKEKYEQYGLSGTESDLLRDNVFLVFRGVDTEARDNLEAYLQEKDENIVFVTKEILETLQGSMFEIVKVEK